MTREQAKRVAEYTQLSATQSVTVAQTKGQGDIFVDFPTQSGGSRRYLVEPDGSSQCRVRNDVE